MEHNMNHIMNHGMDHGIDHGMDHGIDHQEHEWKSNNQIISNATHFMENQDHSNLNKEAMKVLEHHAHGADHAHSGHSMAMTFHGGYVETILFSWWNVKEIGGFIGSFVAIFIMALLYEGLKYYRKHLLWKTYTGLQYCAVAPPDKGVSNLCAADEPQVLHPTMLSAVHAWQTVLHGLQVFVSYMLMLVFMTYNTWLCVAVVLGSATGYFLFGWRESVVVDFTEHCH